MVANLLNKHLVDAVYDPNAIGLRKHLIPL